MSNKENWKVSILEHLSQIEFHTQQVKLLLAAMEDWDITDRPEEPKKPFQFRDATFRYEAKDDQRNRRLMAFYKGLVHLGWIPQQTPMKQFIDLFQAERLYHRIQWTGPKSALAYLFKQLERQGHITLPHARIWTTVRSHFVQPDGQPFAPDLKDQPLPGEKTQAVIRTLLDLLVPERELGGFSIHTFSDE